LHSFSNAVLRAFLSTFFFYFFAFIKESEKDLKELFTQLHPLEIQHMQQFHVLDLELLGEKQTLELKQQLELLISEQRTARQNLNKKQQQEIKDLGENLKKKVDKKKLQIRI